MNTDGLPIAPALELPQDRPAPGMLGLAERGLLPDALLRWGVRRWCAQRLREELAGGLAAQSERFHARLAELCGSVAASLGFARAFRRPCGAAFRPSAS